MKFTISKEGLLKGLQMVQSVITVHSPTAVLFNVLLTCDKENLYLTATDMYITMRYTLNADVKKKGATTIPARRLFNIIRELPEQQVEMEVDEKDTAMIESGSSSIKIFGLSADDFPSMPVFKNERTFSVEQETFREMLRKTSYAVSNDESRPILNGVLLTVKDQKLGLVATDGRRLALIEQELEIPVDVQMNVVVPIKAVNELIKSLADEGNLKIQMDSQFVAFETDNVRIVSKLIEGSYPNFQQVIPSHFEERLTVERGSFMSALRRAALLTNEKFPSVKVEFGKNQIQVSAVTPDVGEAHESVAVKYSGKQIASAFNPDFLIEPLRNLTSDEVYLELVDEMSPVVIKTETPFLYVLMPLRMS
ncbi:DNA polymerase III subunit beta [Verrucomicrobiota bacterium]